MAATPLFLRNRDDLLSRLRLSNVADTDAQSVIDEAITESRLAFYETLGSARVSQIKAMALKDTPDTDDERTRALAAVVESKICRRRLMMTLPTLFMDNSGDARAAWNDEGFLRANKARTQALKDALDQEIADGMNRLSGSDESAAVRVQAASLEPDAADRIEPGSSIWPGGTLW